MNGTNYAATYEKNWLGKLKMQKVLRILKLEKLLQSSKIANW